MRGYSTDMERERERDLKVRGLVRWTCRGSLATHGGAGNPAANAAAAAHLFGPAGCVLRAQPALHGGGRDEAVREVLRARALLLRLVRKPTHGTVLAVAAFLAAARAEQNRLSPPSVRALLRRRWRWRWGAVGAWSADFAIDDGVVEIVCFVDEHGTAVHAVAEHLGCCCCWSSGCEHGRHGERERGGRGKAGE